jgi:hypothetical protein
MATRIRPVRCAAWVGLAVAICGSATAERQPNGPFVDVPSDHTAAAAVTNLAENGLLFGYPDGTFRGSRAITRRELAEALWRVVMQIEQELKQVRSPSAQAKPTVPPQVLGLFADVPPESSLGDLLRDLCSRGILQGYPDATFAPRRVVTRGELELTLWRTLQWVERELSQMEKRPDHK